MISAKLAQEDCYFLPMALHGPSHTGVVFYFFLSSTHPSNTHGLSTHQVLTGTEQGAKLAKPFAELTFYQEEKGCPVVISAGEEKQAEEEVPGVSGIVFSKREDFKKVRELAHL